MTAGAGDEAHEQARVLAESVDLRNPDWRTCLAVDAAAALRGVRIDPLPADHPAAVPADAPGDRDHTPCAHDHARETDPAAGGDLAALSRRVWLAWSDQWPLARGRDHVGYDLTQALDALAAAHRALATPAAPTAATEGGEVSLDDLFSPMKPPRTWWSPTCGLVQDVPTALYVHVASAEPMVAVPDDAVELRPLAASPRPAATEGGERLTTSAGRPVELWWHPYSGVLEAGTGPSVGSYFTLGAGEGPLTRLDGLPEGSVRLHPTPGDHDHLSPTLTRVSTLLGLEAPTSDEIIGAVADLAASPRPAATEGEAASGDEVMDGEGRTWLPSDCRCRELGGRACPVPFVHAAPTPSTAATEGGEPREGLRPDQVRFSIEAFADSVTILTGGVSSRGQVARDLRWAADCVDPTLAATPRERGASEVAAEGVEMKTQIARTVNDLLDLGHALRHEVREARSAVVRRLFSRGGRSG